jgi:hypothetical protein
MSRKVFTAGEVLAAADVNSFLMDQTVMSFAGTAARGSAIPTPTLGMYTHLEDAPQRTEFWNGSAWQSPSGLTLVKQQTIGTTVSSVTVSNAFSAAYDAYKIIVTGGTGTSDAYLQLRLGASSTGYYDSLIWKPYATGLTAASNSNTNKFEYVGNVFPSQALFMDANVLNPFLAKYTMVNSLTGLQSSVATGFYGGIHQVATSYTDFTILVGVGTITGGTISVYGYRKD